MLNSEIKEKAIAALKQATVAYNSAVDEVKSQAERLYSLRKKASHKLITDIEQYINTLANTPKQFCKEFNEIRTYFSDFNHYIIDLEKDANTADYTAGGTAGAGAVMGAGVAILGPTAAMAIATTFGTASTGTAIAALSGGAATNAALAWLGGGALVAGGGGIAGGQALLVLAGPVGWGIGAVALLGGGFWIRGKNKEIAEDATKKRLEIEGYSSERQTMARAIARLIDTTQREMNGIATLLSTLQAYGETDYRRLDSSQKDRLQSLVNHTHALGQLLKKLPNGAVNV